MSLALRRGPESQPRFGSATRPSLQTHLLHGRDNVQTRTKSRWETLDPDMERRIPRADRPTHPTNREL